MPEPPKKLEGIASKRDIQLRRQNFDAIVVAGTCGTLKSQIQNFDVPEGRFWIPHTCWMRQKTGGPITTEEYSAQILTKDSFVRSELIGQLAVDAQGAALYPIQDLRSGMAYEGKQGWPYLMEPGERWNFTIGTAIDGDEWEGRFLYFEIITSSPNRALELYYQYVAGTRGLSQRLGLN